MNCKRVLLLPVGMCLCQRMIGTFWLPQNLLYLTGSRQLIHRSVSPLQFKTVMLSTEEIIRTAVREHPSSAEDMPVLESVLDILAQGNSEVSLLILHRWSSLIFQFSRSLYTLQTPLNSKYVASAVCFKIPGTRSKCTFRRETTTRIRRAQRIGRGSRNDGSAGA